MILMKEKAMERKKTAKRRKMRIYGAMEKCRAVLSVWSEMRTLGEVCKEMEVNWTTVVNWQDAALSGMLKALEPRRKKESGPALSPRLKALLEKRRSSDEGRSGLEKPMKEPELKEKKPKAFSKLEKT